MAEIAYELYSITFIQSIYRGWKARKQLKKLFLSRFISIFLFYKRKLKVIRKSKSCIVYNFRQYLIRKKLISLLHSSCAAIKIQRQFRQRIFQKLAIIFTILRNFN